MPSIPSPMPRAILLNPETMRYANGTVKFTLKGADGGLVLALKVRPPYPISSDFVIYNHAMITVTSKKPRDLLKPVVFLVEVEPYNGLVNRRLFPVYTTLPRWATEKMPPGDICSICCDAENDDEHVKLETCKHIFHIHCIAQIMSRICPLCRQQM